MSRAGREDEAAVRSRMRRLLTELDFALVAETGGDGRPWQADFVRGVESGDPIVLWLESPNVGRWIALGMVVPASPPATVRAFEAALEIASDHDLALAIEPGEPPLVALSTRIFGGAPAAAAMRDVVANLASARAALMAGAGGADGERIDDGRADAAGEKRS